MVALLSLMAVGAEQGGAPCSILKDGTSGHFGHWLGNRMTSTSKKGIIRVFRKRQRTMVKATSGNSPGPSTVRDEWMIKAVAALVNGSWSKRSLLNHSEIYLTSISMVTINKTKHRK